MNQNDDARQPGNGPMNDLVPPNGLLMSTMCGLYNSWLDEMLGRHGPTCMDAVAWLHVRNHAELCQFCRQDDQFIADVRRAAANWKKTIPNRSPRN